MDGRGFEYAAAPHPGSAHLLPVEGDGEKESAAPLGGYLVASLG